MPIYVGGRDTSLRVLGAGPGEGDPSSKALRVAPVTVGVVKSFFFTENGLNVSRLRAALRGQDGAAATWTVMFAPKLGVGGTEVIENGTTTTDDADGTDDILFSNAVIPANSFVWIDITGVAGSLDELAVTVLPES